MLPVLDESDSNRLFGVGRLGPEPRHAALGRNVFIAGNYFRSRTAVRHFKHTTPAVRVRLPKGRFFRAEFFRVSAFFQRRNPPRNALAFLPARQPGGSSFNFLTLPPPSTTSSGSMAATNRSTTSATYPRHFFLPYFSSPRIPT